MLWGQTNTTWINNIGYGSSTHPVIFWDGANRAGQGTNSWSHNLTFNGTQGQQSVAVSGTGNDNGNLAVILSNNSLVGANPNLTKVSTLDFHPLSGSPVLNAGINGPPGYTLYTVDSQTQPNPPNIGAYNATGSPPPTLIYPLPTSCTRNLYVANNGVDAAGRGTQSAPWATLAYADSNGGLRAGDCVNVGPGTYSQSHTLTFNHGGNVNKASGYVTWIGSPNQQSIIKAATPGIFFLVTFNASYVAFNGFEVDGNQVQEYAIHAGAYHNSSPLVSPHHLMILNNLIHDSGGGGIGVNSTDYITIAGNVIHDTCHNTNYHDSGITVWEPSAIPGFAPTLPWDSRQFHIQIVENILYNNYEGPSIPAGTNREGNAIAIGDTYHTQWDNVHYQFYGLVQSNLALNNGGACVKAFASGNLIVENTTCYNNNKDTMNSGTLRGELSHIASENITWVNNLTLPVPIPSDPILQWNTGISFSGQPSNKVIFSHNLTFDGTVGHFSVQVKDTNNHSTNLTTIIANNKLLGKDPVLQSISTYNFRPLPGSPVISGGFLPTPNYPPHTLDGGAVMTRPPNVG